MSKTHSLTGHLAFSVISPFVIGSIRSSLRFYNLELDEEAISDIWFHGTFPYFLEGEGDFK